MLKLLYAFLFIFTLIFSFAHENVNISVLLDVSYLSRNISNDNYLKTEIPRYLHSIDGHEDGQHAHAIRLNGFNLNYGEIAFLLPVEKNIDLFGTFHLAQYTFEIEELYMIYEEKSIKSKVGKFRSEVGILSKQHDHDWYFYELPYVNYTFLGYHGLNEVGIQLTLSNSFFLIGGEYLNGDNENSFGYGNASLYTVFVKPRYKFLSTGVSFIQGKNKNEDTVNIYIVELILNTKKFLLQSEYMYRSKYENIYKNQWGFYIFGIYKLNKNIDFGYRYDYLDTNLYRHSFVLNLYKSSNIRIRFQYNIDRARYLNEVRTNINEFIIELTLSKGFKF